jgi:hypothetical protein
MKAWRPLRRHERKRDRTRAAAQKDRVSSVVGLGQIEQNPVGGPGRELTARIQHDVGIGDPREDLHEAAGRTLPAGHRGAAAPPGGLQPEGARPLAPGSITAPPIDQG